MLDFNEIAEFVEGDIKTYIHTLKEDNVDDELLEKVREKCYEILGKYRHISYQGVLNKIKVFVDTDCNNGIAVILTDIDDDLKDINGPLN